jgi:quercetin dioxygenase-like cupin family protein
MDNLFFPDAGLVPEVLDGGRMWRKLRARGGSLMLVEMHFEQGAVGAEHRHPHEQLCYCLEGEFLYSIEGEKATLRPGDSVFVPASALHGALCVAAGRLLDIFTPQRDDFLKP